MSSRIEQLIDEIEDYIESCKPKFMSSTEIIVNKDEIDELLRELPASTTQMKVSNWGLYIISVTSFY